MVTTLKQCFSLTICFQRSSLFKHPKFFGTSPQLWCHKTMYYFLKKTSCPEKPLDLTVLPVKHYFSKVRKKDITTKAFVLINHCFINFFFWLGGHVQNHTFFSSAMNSMRNFWCW